MQQRAKKGLLVALAASGALASAAVGTANADSGAQGSAVGSPGVLSGNNVQVPVHVPVNICGNTVNVVGLLNPAFGNNCANVSGVPDHPTNPPHTSKPPTSKPPTSEPPIKEPPTSKPPTSHPPKTPPTKQPPHDTTGGWSNGGWHNDGHDKPSHPKDELAHTGSSATTLFLLPAGAALVLGGAVLYRRTRTSDS